jgi:hypothetical protein
MLSGVVLLAVQLVVGFMATPRLLQALPPFGGLSIFVYAVPAGLVVWLVGLALSQVLRDTRQPSGATLMAAILVALAGRTPHRLPRLPARGAAQCQARCER